MEHCDQIYDGLECRIRETAVRGLNVTTPIWSVLFEVLASSVSIIETTSVISHNLGVTPVAIAGVFFL